MGKLSLLTAALKRLKEIWEKKDFQTLFGNIFSLSILQASNRIFPLITLPYLLRVIGPDKFGLIVFAQAVITYFQMLIDYGFSLSATKEIADCMDNKLQVRTVFSSVLIIKFILFIFSFAILYITVKYFDRFHQDQEIFFFSFLVLIGPMLYPDWLFHGIQKMKYVTIINVISKALFTVMIFFFIKGPEDYLLVPLITSAGNMVAGIIGLTIAYFSFKIYFIPVNIKEIIKRFKGSSIFFLSRISTTFFTTTNSVFLGIFLSNEAVAFYAAAEKIYNALVMLIHPFSASLYPYMAKTRNILFFKKFFRVTTIINTFSWIIIIFFSSLIIRILFGTQYQQSQIILQILCLGGILNIPSILLGFPLLAAFGYVKWATYSVIISGFAHLFFLFITIPFISCNVVAILVVISHLLALSIRIHGAKKNIFLPQTIQKQ